MGETYPDNNFTGKDIISIHDFTRGNIEYLIEKTRIMKKAEYSGLRYANDKLKNKAAALLFFEDSTRTRISTERAMKELSGGTFGFSGKEGTSLMKKENIFSTIDMMWAYHANIAIMRHGKDGSVQWAADVLGIPTINAGDGTNEHPTQANLDMFTIDELHPGINGVTIGVGGDLKYGRTIRSLCLALSLFDNVTINWAADDNLGMPNDLVKILEDKSVKVNRMDNIEEALNNSKIFYMTRPQIERIHDLSSEEVHNIMLKYQLTSEKIDSEVKILHPLPVNKEIAEIDFSVFYHKGERFFTQAENGLFFRKALLLEILENQEGYTNFSPKINPDIVKANNKKILEINNDETDKSKYFVDKISNGVVIDHIDRGKAQLIDNKLKLSESGYAIATVSNDRSSRYEFKDLIKFKKGKLTDRQMKMIALISPRATFNIINGGKVIEKFNYKLCSNNNCISLDVTEDVPPRFDGDNCHYCRTEYAN